MGRRKGLDQELSDADPDSFPEAHVSYNPYLDYEAPWLLPKLGQ
jgi:hypothetical protein